MVQVERTDHLLTWWNAPSLFYMLIFWWLPLLVLIFFWLNILTKMKHALSPRYCSCTQDESLTAPVKLPKEDWLTLTAWRWELYECENVAKKKSSLKILLSKSFCFLVLFCKPPSLLYKLIQRAHTPHSVCSYILPHGALSSGHPVTIETHTHIYTHHWN